MKRNQKFRQHRAHRQNRPQSSTERLRQEWKELRREWWELRREWRGKFRTFSSTVTRLLREMIRELAALPRVAQIIVVVGIMTNFFVITQWERLGFGTHHPAPSQPATSTLPPQDQQRPAGPSAVPSSENINVEDAETTRAKRIGRLIINDTRVNANGSIVGKDRTLYLYGIKPFNSKNICRRASGEPWACGLQAYAGLRNAIEHQTIICEPRKVLADGLSVTCRIGAADIATTLVRNGLVEVESNIRDPELSDAQAFAKSKKMGIWDR